MEKFIIRLDRILTDRPNIHGRCLSSDNGDIVLLEDNKNALKTIFTSPSLSKEYKDQNCFLIENPQQKDVYLWAVDGCFVQQGGTLSKKYPKKCDCAFGYENFIGFLEFKLDADPAAHPLTIEKKRKDAIEQIEHTVCFVRDALGITDTFLSIEGYEIEAYICTPPLYPNKNTSITSFAIEFLEHYGIELFEKSYKICH